MTARRKRTSRSQSAVLSTVSPGRGIELLQRAHSEGKDLLARGFGADDYAQWETTTRGSLEKSFGSDSPNVARVLDVGKYGSFPMGKNPQWWAEHRAESLGKQVRMLEGLIEVLRVDLEGPAAEPAPKMPLAGGRKVFVVHGHDKAAMLDSVRFLEKLDLHALVLHEQPDGGRTIIEKFVDYSDVGFAVVLLTPDDRGGVASASYEEQQLRARQNVILELGYFLGKLGRGRVCVLYVKGVEIPSDYHGVMFIPLDEAGAWRLRLARELKAAGFDVDMNLAV